MNKKVSEIARNINEKYFEKNKLKIIVIVGIAGILLIFLSDLFSTSPKKNIKPTKELSVDTSTYKAEMEKELTKILTEIRGVGKVKVMLTIEGSTEYVFAEEVNSKKEDSSDKHSEDYQNKYVIIEKNGEKEALVKKILKPKIVGVLIVCEGGNSPIVCEKVYKAVSAVLGLSYNNICVVTG